MADEIQDQPTSAAKLAKARERFKLSLVANADWRVAAREDYRFVQGKQWDKADIDLMAKQKRPTITINICRAYVNQISGYFGKNTSEAKFEPRGKSDDAICNIAKGITKYVYDTCMFPRNKKKVGKDRLVCGIGYYWVFYDFDYDKMDGVIKIERRSPFEIFKDPESVKEDLSDASFCGTTTWEDPEELKGIFPEYAEEIDKCTHKYDKEEQAAENRLAGEDLWYSSQLKKLRVVQYWYKEQKYKAVYEFNGQPVDASTEVEAMAKLRVPGMKKHRVPSTEIYFMTFVDDVILEEGKSPYEHKRFPLVPEFAYYLGEKDENDTTLEPAGIIRDLKPVQREKNKMRSQRIDMVNKQVAGVRFFEGPTTPEFERELNKNGNTPGANLFMPPGMTVTISQPAPMSAANIEMEKIATEDFNRISGVNPETMGSQESPNYMSGVAIDRRQQASLAQLSDLNDEGAYSERLILDLLWGDKGRPGLIPQYFTSEKVMRIMGDDGENQFVNIAPNPNGQEAQHTQTEVDPATGQLVEKVLYDLSKFEFDIVVGASQNNPTLLTQNMYQMIEAKKVGIDIPTDMFLETMQMANKDEIRKRIQEQAANKQEPIKTSLSISFEDLPVEAKSQVLASQGIKVSPQNIAQEEMAKITKGASVQQQPQMPQPMPQMPQPEQQPMPQFPGAGMMPG